MLAISIQVYTLDKARINGQTKYCCNIRE